MTVLYHTDANRIAAALVEERRTAGSPAMGMVMTLVIVVREEESDGAVKAALEAAREHPSRLLAVIVGSARGPSEITAEIRAGAGAAGELALIRLNGAVTRHPESVVLPLLLPDSPVVVWWPSTAPADPAHDPVGGLANRRITDAAQVSTGRNAAMLTQCASYAPGNTDLAWTRLTGWRALLASAMDQSKDRVTGVSVEGERISPSADLLGAWLSDRLKVPVERRRSEGPGITEVTLQTRDGAIRISRPDGRLATLTVPGQPDRPVALRRRTIPELLAEELRRLDPDDVYAATVRRLHAMSSADGKRASKSATRKSTVKPTADKSSRTRADQSAGGPATDDDATTVGAGTEAGAGGESPPS